jgi:hypothetical protein
MDGYCSEYCTCLNMCDGDTWCEGPHVCYNCKEKARELEEAKILKTPKKRVRFNAKQPRLMKVDLSKGDGCQHPDIECKRQYLAKIGGRYFAGTFSR